MKWHSSPKGYTTGTPDGRRFTVFYKEGEWIGVEDGVYTDPFDSVFDAMDFLEREYGFEADRTGVLDVPPAERQGTRVEQDELLQKIRRAKEQARAAREQQQRVENEFRRRAEQERQEQQAYYYFRQAFGQAFGQNWGQSPVQRPEWAVVLELPGNGPWKADFVKAQFRALAKKHHPDVGGSTEHMARIIQAWSTVQKLFNI